MKTIGRNNTIEGDKAQPKLKVKRTTRDSNKTNVPLTQIQLQVKEICVGVLRNAVHVLNVWGKIQTMKSEFLMGI